MEGIECNAEGPWLSTKMDPDEANRALLLPLPSPSSAHVVIVVLLVQT